MKGKEIAKWLSGFFGGVFLGALVACPVKEVSLPVSIVICIALGYIGWK